MSILSQMDRGEFQQDSVLKQLEVLKEEEKEFQNLKVSCVLGPACVPSAEMGSEPLGHPWQNQLIPHCCCQAACPWAMSPVWPVPRAVPVQGDTVWWPQQLFF